MQFSPVEHHLLIAPPPPLTQPCSLHPDPSVLGPRLFPRGGSAFFLPALARKFIFTASNPKFRPHASSDFLPPTPSRTHARTRTHTRRGGDLGWCVDDFPLPPPIRKRLVRPLYTCQGETARATSTHHPTQSRDIWQAMTDDDAPLHCRPSNSHAGVKRRGL